MITLWYDYHPITVWYDLFKHGNNKWSCRQFEKFGETPWCRLFRDDHLVELSRKRDRNRTNPHTFLGCWMVDTCYTWYIRIYIYSFLFIIIYMIQNTHIYIYIWLYYYIRVCVIIIFILTYKAQNKCPSEMTFTSSMFPTCQMVRGL